MVIDQSEGLSWSDLSHDDLMTACAAYYYFSMQFVEAVDIACELYPSDPKLIELRRGECDTDNLSPYPGVARPGEKMNHDEFMRGAVMMSSLDRYALSRVESLGGAYLAEVHQFDPVTRALSLSSYKDGGLEKVFSAILTAWDWDETSLGAFRHFLVQHFKLDSGEHGSLCRHLVADGRIQRGSSLAPNFASLQERSVVVVVRDMAKAAESLIDLDGWARRIVLCPPKWELSRVESAAGDAAADALVLDGENDAPQLPIEVAAPCHLPLQQLCMPRAACRETEWILPTSGTTGPPKLVIHTLRTLIGAIADAPLQQWATFTTSVGMTVCRFSCAR